LPAKGSQADLLMHTSRGSLFQTLRPLPGSSGYNNREPVVSLRSTTG
jgi:hypothetical protein